MESFHCTGCGLCCTHIGPVIEKARQQVAARTADAQTAEIARFPHAWDATGRCEMLDAAGKCSVYDRRPLVCNVEKTWEKYFAHLVSRQHYFALSELSCKLLQDGKIF